MSEEEIKKLLLQNLELSEKIHQELAKQRRARMWTLAIGIIVIVLPIIVGIIAMPWMIKTIQSYYGGSLNF